VTPQHVLAEDAAGGVGVIRCRLHYVVLAEHVFNCNSVQRVRCAAP
jgi:hypothetical protein